MINTEGSVNDTLDKQLPRKKTKLSRLYIFIKSLIDAHHLSYDEHMEYFQILLRNVGCTLLTRDPNIMFNVCYGSMGFMHFGYIVFSDIYFISTNMDDISKVTECLTTMIVGLACMLKCMLLVIFRTRILALMDDLREFCDEAQAEGNQEWDLMVRQLAEARVTTRLYVRVVDAAIVCFVVSAASNYEERGLPFVAPMAGISRHHPVGYFVNFILHFWAMTLVRNLLSSFLAILVYSWVIMAGRFDVLNYRLAIIGRHAAFWGSTPVVMHNDGLIQHEEMSVEHRMDHAYVRSYLRNCYQVHQKLFSVADRMNVVFEYDCLAEILWSTLVGCVSLFQITNSDGENTIVFFLYYACCISQIFYYCWYCELVMGKSLQVCDSIGLVPWYRFTPEDQKTLGVMLLRAQRPMLMTAVFFILNLEMFSTIMKATYSYYAVLTSVDEEAKIIDA